jgi:hypothetical protein
MHTYININERVSDTAAVGADCCSGVKGRQGGFRV